MLSSSCTCCPLPKLSYIIHTGQERTGTFLDGHDDIIESCRQPFPFPVSRDDDDDDEEEAEEGRRATAGCTSLVFPSFLHLDHRRSIGSILHCILQNNTIESRPARTKGLGHLAFPCPPDDNKLCKSATTTTKTITTHHQRKFDSTSRQRISFPSILSILCW